MTMQYTMSRNTSASSASRFRNKNTNPEDPRSGSLWDPIVHRALRRVLAAADRERSGQFDTSREARYGVDPASRKCGELPVEFPKTVFLAALAQELIDQVVRIQEAASQDRQPHGASAVAKYISRFTANYCGNELKLNWSFSWPAPAWFSEDLNEADLILTGVQFWRAAMETFNDELRKAFAEVGTELIRVGLARLQPSGKQM